MSDAVMIFDAQGVLLADVVGSGVSRQAAATRSGNPNHDTRSGKFGGGGGGKRRNATPANVDPAAYARYLDAVREAARKFPGQLTDENLASFIKSRAANPNAVNIQQFLALARGQQIQDVIDALDQNHGGFKLEAPQGYVKKVLAGLSDDDVSEIVARLKARGIKDPHIKFGRSLPKDRHETVKTKTAEREAKVQASDEWSEIAPDQEPPPLTFADLAQTIKSAFAELEMPQPVVQFEMPPITVTPPEVIVNLPLAPRTRKVVERDEMGLITQVTEVED